jgi:hypothetical protein
MYLHIFFAENGVHNICQFSKKIAYILLSQTIAKNNDHNVSYQRKSPFFRRKLAKIFIITLVIKRQLLFFRRKLAKIVTIALVFKIIGGKY